MDLTNPNRSIYSRSHTILINAHFTCVHLIISWNGLSDNRVYDVFCFFFQLPGLQNQREREQARTTKLAKSSEPNQTTTEPAKPSTSGASFSEPAETELDPETPEEYEESSAMANFASEWVKSLSSDDLL